jgi:hypothetical protein
MPTTEPTPDDDHLVHDDDVPATTSTTRFDHDDKLAAAYDDLNDLIDRAAHEYASPDEYYFEYYDDDVARDVPVRRGGDDLHP